MEDTTLRDRPPSVAGSFYESTSSALNDRLDWCFLHKVGPGKLPGAVTSETRAVISVVSPHAGYIYSGPVAAHGYCLLSTEPAPELIVIIGPNHTGWGAGVSVWDGGDWQTPLGKVQVDSVAAKALCKMGVAELDSQAHIREHSVEVQVPFLQRIYHGGFRILPICMMLQDYETSAELGRSLSQLLAGRSSLLIASTDFSHYEPYATAYAKDAKVAEAIVNMDPKAVEEIVQREGVSMCGPGPVMATMVASQGLGAKACRKLCYATSGDTSGTKNEVVGYGSFAMTR